MRTGPDLAPVGRVEIITVIDNYVDLILEDEAPAFRPKLDRDGMVPDDTLLAEHGLALWLRIGEEPDPRNLLFDAGYSPVAAVRNMDLLGLDPGEIEAVVISHGHEDHTGGLRPMVDRLRPGVTLAAHPGALTTERYIERKDGSLVRFPNLLGQAGLDRAGAELVDTSRPVVLAGGRVLITGPVPRRTAFETGLSGAKMIRDGRLVTDEIEDDQGLVLLLEGKGLVVLAGCAHAGIINTIDHARRLTGENRVYAVMGGFHLSGADGDRIGRTVAALREISPRYVIPTHCTGWEAARRLAAELPQAFVLNSVGTRIILET